jgi:tRNA A-37 threonylcarbamoyl transferase component Bud32
MTTTASIFPARYGNVERIARGAMGDVYRATDSSLGRIVAIKVLSTPFVGDDAARRRFAREARAAARLSSEPGVVTIYDVGEANDRPYLVMEYMAGGTLEERLHAEGAQPAARALQWLEQAARALDWAHASGIVHRDVKPGNLLLDAGGRVQVADFGIASATGTTTLTAAGTVLGTVGYLAPEQAAGERVTSASDRYALGVVAYELLTGERPFARESPTAEAAAHVSAPVPLISERSNLPGALDAVFARALAKQPEERYASCAEFVAAVRAAFERTEQATRTYDAVAAPTIVRAHSRSARWPLVVAAFGAALAAGVVLAAVLSSPTSEPTRRQAAPKRHTAERATTARASTATTAPATTSAAPPASTSTAAAATADDPHTLNDRAWSLMKQGDYASALPLLERAVPALEGSGPADPFEGYANYNLGYTLLQLGRCSDALPYLDHAKELEPERTEVDAALQSVGQCLAPAKGKKKGKKGRH